MLTTGTKEVMSAHPVTAVKQLLDIAGEKLLSLLLNKININQCCRGITIFTVSVRVQTFEITVRFGLWASYGSGSVSGPVSRP